MSGQLNNTSSAGGECPLVAVWKILGGYGGGGASCGPGGGGGAGYHGVVHFLFSEICDGNLAAELNRSFLNSRESLEITINFVTWRISWI